MEIRRPSFMRASSHTFEYVGYGPGNYSTAIPQKQIRTLTEDDILTSQAREQAGGTVVYTGTNDLGEFYSGTKKLSSATGEEKVIDAPIITFTGDDAQGENQNRSSGIFDDVLVKEKITVEGGENGTQSSQFYGPVNFSKKVTNTADEGINTKNLFIKGTASQSKLITVGIQTPTSSTVLSYNSGDISLKSNPTDNYIGQVYLNDKWKKFGLISNSADILDIKVDRLGIGDTTAFVNVGGVGDAELYVAGDVKIQNLTVNGSVSFQENVVLNDVNFADINIQKTAKFSGIGGTSYAIFVYDPGTIVNSQSVPVLKTRLYDLEVSNNAYALGSVGIGTTNPSSKLTILGGSSSPLVKVTQTGSGDAFVVEDTSNDTTPFVIDASGRVGLGTTIPTSNLTVQDTTSLPLVKLTQNGSGNAFVVEDAFNDTTPFVINALGHLGIGTTNPGLELVVNGTIGIDASSSTSGRTQLSSSSSGFVLNHNDNSPIIIQTQSVERLRIGAGGTVTATANNSLTETRGSHLRITNIGSGGDTVISWDNNSGGTTKQRWYAGIDVSDSYAWKLAKPITTNFDDENFDRPSSGGNSAETKLKIDINGNATFLGNLTSTAGGLTLNANKFTVAGATGNTVIAGSLDIGAAFNVTVSSSNKFSVDTSGNVTNAGTLTATGRIKTFNNLEVSGSATVSNNLEVLNQITSPSFKVTNATDPSLFLRAPGTAAALTKSELDAAAGFSIQPPVINSTLPNGNSIQLQSLTFDGNGASGTRIFALKLLDNTAFTPISAENILVSVGGIIQRANTDYTVSGSNITFPASAWTNPPAAGLSSFIIAFGGLGGLTQNQDWDGVKGVLLVGSATDNLGIKLGVGSNNQVLTADSSTATGLAWKAIPEQSLFTSTAWDGKGDLLVGTGADTADKLTVGSNNAILTADSTSTTGLAWKNSISVSGNISGAVGSFTGNVTAFASDIRLKTNIEYIENAVDKVVKLSGFTYNFNEKGSELGFDSSVRYSGVSAQEVQEVLPEAVFPAPISDKYLTVQYDKLVPLLIEAIKEQQETITNLQNRLEILEGD